SVAMAVRNDAARCQACFIFRRERKLVETVWRRLTRRQEVERKYRWTPRDESRCGYDLFASQRTHDDVSAFLRGALDLLLHTGLPRVINSDGLSLCFGFLIVGGHEAVANSSGCGCSSPRNRQQQGDVRAATGPGHDRRLLHRPAQELAADHIVRRVVG